MAEPRTEEATRQLMADKARARLADMPAAVTGGEDLTIDPVPWAAAELGIECWSRQAELVRMVPLHESSACRSGHKVSKSNSAAVIALWWTQRYPDGQVIFTAPTQHQVKHILWAEMRRVLRKGRLAVPTQPLDPALGIQWPDGRYIRGLSTKDPEAFAGISGPRMLYIVDESSGVEDGIFEAIEGNLAGGAHILMLGNPTQPTGQFQRAFHAEREFWHTMHISSEESPNVVSGKPLIPGLATRKWVVTRKKKWGIDSPLYQVRVAGNFATSASDTIIGLGAVTTAVAAYDMELELTEALEIGVDVARFGDDDSVITPRRGMQSMEQVVLSGFDIEDVVHKIVEAHWKHHRKGERKTRVRIDIIGVGLAVAKLLQVNHRDIITVELITVSENSNDPEKYADLRTEIWFRAGEWLKTGAIPDEPELQAELISPKYGFDKKGRLLMESKDSLRKRLKRSPDRADSFCLSVFGGSSGIIRTTRQRTTRRDERTGRPRTGRLRWGGAGRGY